LRTALSPVRLPVPPPRRVSEVLHTVSGASGTRDIAWAAAVGRGSPSKVGPKPFWLTGTVRSRNRVSRLARSDPARHVERCGWMRQRCTCEPRAERIRSSRRVFRESVSRRRRRCRRRRR
jgi:hypothetical protein